VPKRIVSGKSDASAHNVSLVGGEIVTAQAKGAGPFLLLPHKKSSTSFVTLTGTLRSKRATRLLA
jgi:hypothetical protein